MSLLPWRKPPAKLRCSECGESYKAYRVFTDPKSRKQLCFPSCDRNAADVAALNAIPDEVNDKRKLPSGPLYPVWGD